MEDNDVAFRHGARLLGAQTTQFRVWAPGASRVELQIERPGRELAPMQRSEAGYWERTEDSAPAGTRYRYRVDGGSPRPDPASRFQPEGVHGPSEVIDAAFGWTDQGWTAPPLDRCVLYELHVGVFTPEGTFDAIVPRLEELRELGVTLIELMPVAQFPGARNWGYDGVFPFAAQNSYGGPDGLRRLVDACHGRGIGVAMDVVYNHLGPEGNYLAEFGPYFTGRHRTPWGPAINFDGPASDEVRRYFIENALAWVRDFHMDALRLDAVHGIFDSSAYPFLEELADAVRALAARLGRRVHVIAESDANDPRLIRPKCAGGYGLDAQWADGFHHALRVLMTGEREGYFQDYGELRHLAKAFEEGFVYTGEYSTFRGRRHGAPARDVSAERFVVCSQNHDQAGNRMLGERLASLVRYEDLKLAAAAVILSPHTPLLFMGEEYGEPAPFLYFVSHSDPDLVEAVRRGRAQEFAAFSWRGEPPDPQAEETFLRSKLDSTLRGRERHAQLLAYYKELLRLRREVSALASLDKDTLSVEISEESRALLVRRWRDDDETILVLCFSESAVRLDRAFPPGRWWKMLDSADALWLGPGGVLPERIDQPGQGPLTLAPRSAALYRRQLGV